MPGHLFVVQADLTRLEVDALAVPTDQLRAVEPSWLEHAPEGLRSTKRTEFLVEQGDVVRWREWDDGRAAYLVDVGRAEPQKPEWYAERAIAYLDAAAGDLPERATPARARKLIGLPVFGARRGGAKTIAGDVIAALVERVHDRVRAREWEHDVVLALQGHDTFAACQQVRRRLTASGPAGHHADLADELADKARQGNLVLFIGAGVSMAAGLPSWRGLLDTLAKDADLPADVRRAMAVPNGISLLDEARIISDAYLRQGRSLGDAIAAHMKRDRYALSHALLASMPINEVVTTNYDKLFEMAAEDARHPASVLPYDAVAPGHRWLLKMHGTIDPPRNIVLTREDYLDYGRTRGALLGIVQALLITRHMLFAGFSLDDDNFIRVAHDVRTAIGLRDANKDPFGTVLTLVDDPVRRMVWERDFRIAAMESGGTDQTRAARTLEILLDDVLARSRPYLSHLLEPAFDRVLDDDERAMSTALRELAAQSRRTSTWQPVNEFLARFGAS